MDVAGEVLAMDSIVEGCVEVLVGVGASDCRRIGTLVGTLLEVDTLCNETEHGVELSKWVSCGLTFDLHPMSQSEKIAYLELSPLMFSRLDGRHLWE